MIRLLLVIPSLDESGAEKQLMLLATGLPRDEFDVRVVVLTRMGPYAARLQEAGIPVELLGKRFRFDPVCLWKLRRLIQSWKPDVVHTWLFAGNTYGRMAAGGEKGPPVIVSERCVDSWKQGWQLWLDRKLVSRTKKLVGNGTSVVEFYRNLGYGDEQLRVIRNGVPLEPGPVVAHPQRDDYRREWSGGHPAPFIVGFVGRLAVQKRIEDLVWSMELLKSARDDMFLVLVGEGPLREEMEKFATYFGIQKRVHFLGHRHDAKELMTCFDAFVLASDFEGQSNSLMEAMGLGLPVVVSDILANRELVTDGENGRVFPVGDRVKLSQELQRTNVERETSQRLGMNARQKMLQEFGVERMVREYAELYRETVKSAVFSDIQGN